MERLVAAFSEKGELERQSRVIIQQFQVAESSLHAAQHVLAQFMISQIEEGIFEEFNLAHFKGSFYPLFNFSVLFQKVPGLELFFDFMLPPSAGKKQASAATPAAKPHKNKSASLLGAQSEQGRGLLNKAPELFSKISHFFPGNRSDSPQS